MSSYVLATDPSVAFTGGMVRGSETACQDLTFGRCPERARVAPCPLRRPVDSRSVAAARRPRAAAVAGRRDRELAPRAGEVRLDLERLAGLAPAELGAEDLRDARRDRRAAVRQLLGEPGPARQDVVERQRELVAGRPGDLGLEERRARRRAAAAGRSSAPERDDGRRLRPVPGDEPRRRPRAEVADRRDRRRAPPAIRASASVSAAPTSRRSAVSLGRAFGLRRARGRRR